MRRILSYLLFLLLAAVLLYFSFRGVHWGDFWDGLKSADFSWIAASMALGVLGFWIRGLRWRLLIRGAGHKVTRSQAFDAVNMAYLTNFALPRAGELARCGVLTKSAGVPFDVLLGTVVLERAFDTLCLLIIIAAVICGQWSLFGGFMYRELWQPLSATGQDHTLLIVVVLAVLLLMGLLIMLYRKRLAKLTLIQKIRKMVRGVWEGLCSGFRMPQKFSFFAYTLLLWGCYWGMCLCTLWAFPAVRHLNGLDAAFLMAVGGLGWAIPVQGGIGAYHFIISLALTTVYGIAQTQGMVFATISHESQAVTMIVFGLYSLVHIAFTTRKVKK